MSKLSAGSPPRSNAVVEVEVFDNGSSLGTTTTDVNGNWSKGVSNLALGSHSLRAVIVSGAASNPRNFTVESPLPGFVLDPAPVALTGRIIRFGPDGPVPINWPANTTNTRVPTAGVPPYTYRSSNRNIAAVNTSGRVNSERNGTAIITVTDSAGRSGTYQVTVSNAVWCQGLSMGNYAMALQFAANAGLRIPSIGELQEIWNLYGSLPGLGNAYYWSSTIASALLKTHYMKNLVTGSETTLKEASNANIVGVS